MRNERARRLLNLAAFNGGWWACALSAAAGQAWWGTAVVGALVTIHLWFAPFPAREALFLSIVGLAGAVIDFSLFGLGILLPPEAGLPVLFLPIWLAGLHVNLGTVVNASLAWLAERPVLAALLGATGGPLAYYSAAQVGAMQLNENLWLALGVLAVLWAIVTPGLFLLSRSLGLSSLGRHSVLIV